MAKGAVRVRNRLVALLMLAAVLVGGMFARVSHEEQDVLAEMHFAERNDGTYMSIVDEDGQVLHCTGHNVCVDDEWVTNDDRLFQVVKVEGDTAYAKFMGMYGEHHVYAPASAGLLEQLRSRILPVASQPANKVAIYHTHSDESYVPSDGTSSSEAKGGIYKVGSTLKAALGNLGVNVTHDQTLHHPHDAGAYQRSRRTAAALLRQRPAALVDLHRDSAPPQAYGTEVSGEPVTQVMAVVGKGNPKWRANAAFARNIKAEVDKIDPELWRGTLFRSGTFNQDLYERSILLEVGAHTNKREHAERAVELVAPAIARAAGAAPGSGAQATESRGSLSALGWIVGLTALGAVVYMFVSTGSLKEAMSKLRRFAREDLAGFLGWRSPRRSPEGSSRPDEPEQQTKREPSNDDGKR